MLKRGRAKQVCLKLLSEAATRWRMFDDLFVMMTALKTVSTALLLIVGQGKNQLPLTYSHSSCQLDNNNIYVSQMRHTWCGSVGELGLEAICSDVGRLSTTVFSWMSITLCSPEPSSSANGHTQSFPNQINVSTAITKYKQSVYALKMHTIKS